MIKNDDLPIGFTMALAEHSDSLNRFAQLSSEEQAEIVRQARHISSREEMQNYVRELFVK